MMVILSRRSLFKWTLMCSIDSLTFLLVRMAWGQASRSAGLPRRKDVKDALAWMSPGKPLSRAHSLSRFAEDGVS
jgi:hypothetical protein